MARREDKQGRPSALELLEESFHLLRRSPGHVLAGYYIGALPFALAALYFVADMSRAGLAASRLTAGSLALAALLVWMKCWQSRFMRQLLAIRCGQGAPSWPAGRLWRMATTQAAVQPLGLLVLLAAGRGGVWLWQSIMATIRAPGPFGLLVALAALALALAGLAPVLFVYAFHQNLSLFGDGEEDGGRIGPAVRRAIRQAILWPKQNLAALLVLILFALFVMLNLILAIFLAGSLAKSLLGVNSPISRGGFSQLNTTFLSVGLALTYLCVDPIVKAFYTLRCFYGRSIRTGQDLTAELQLLKGGRVAATAAVIVAALAVFAPARALADELPADAPSAAGAPSMAVESQQLDESIRQVINRREYVYRRPAARQDVPAKRGWWDSFWNWWRNVRNKVFPERQRRLPDPVSSVPGRGWNWTGAMNLVLYALLAASMTVLILTLWRAYRRRKSAVPIVTGKTVIEANIEDDDVTADQLPEDDWLSMARQLLKEGKRQLALRAMYLASLSLLGQQKIIAIAKFKSNYEYEAEVRRRAHAVPGLIDAFSQNVGYFEDAWYGMHDVSEQTVSAFIANQKRIRRLVIS